MRVLENPLPISKPLVAGIESMAFARLASRRSNTGSPRPGGELRIRQRMVPPRESPSVLVFSMRLIICWAIWGLGQRTGLLSISSREGKWERFGILRVWMDST